jgi:geranylgeranyl diphosphate synthase type II
MIDSRLSELYEAYRKEHAFAGKPDSLYESMQYIMDLGGKRIRPLLVLMAAESAGGSAKEALPLAHVVEIFHNFSLVHDDIMDQALVRRGKPTVHQRWNTPTAILAGDNMLVMAFEVWNRYQGLNKSELFDAFAQTAKAVCEGQQKDMDFAEQAQVDIADYLEMIEQKTAVLLGCALQMGALTAGVDHELAELYYQLGCSVGLSFQMIDDHLDSFGTQAQTGKRLGGDIAEGKKTWLYLRSAQISQEVHRLFAEKEDEDRIQAVRALWVNQGLDTGLLELAESYHQKAQAQLSALQEKGCDVQALNDLCDWLLARQH